MAKTPKLDFEDACAKLAAIISTLEDENTSLQASLKAFEQGIMLARQAQQSLLEAEQKVQLLLDSEGEPKSMAFDDGQVE